MSQKAEDLISAHFKVNFIGSLELSKFLGQVDKSDSNRLLVVQILLILVSFIFPVGVTWPPAALEAEAKTFSDAERIGNDPIEVHVQQEVEWCRQNETPPCKVDIQMQKILGSSNYVELKHNDGEAEVGH